MGLITKVKETFGISDPTKIGCRAIVNKKTGKTCDGSSWGRGHVDGHEVKYCQDHAPSDAASAHMGGTPVLRTDPVLFYIPENDTTIEVK